MIIKAMASIFSRLKSIPDPELTPDRWCEVQPCLNISFGSRKIILTQPTSSFFVYFLGILTIGVGLHFFWTQDGEISRFFWGISLVLWGIGALLAGTSYQAFGYEIKCAGQESCAWTSWWEVSYLMVQQLSTSAMLAGVAYACTGGLWRTGLLSYAIVNALVYIILAAIGGIVPIKSLITFELMVLFSVPIIVIFLILNGWRYHTLGNPMDLILLGTWILLTLTVTLYWLYYKLGITQTLWANGKGIWFSENDVLHVCLVFWMIFIVTVVAGHIKDYVS